MTGQEFKQIRRFTGVSQKQIANELGLKTHCSISYLERRNLVPIHIERILIKLCKLDNLSPSDLYQYLEDIFAIEKPKYIPLDLERIFPRMDWFLSWDEFVDRCKAKFNIRDIEKLREMLDLGIRLNYLQFDNYTNRITLLPDNYRYYKQNI